MAGEKGLTVSALRSKRKDRRQHEGQGSAHTDLDVQSNSNTLGDDHMWTNWDGDVIIHGCKQ